VDIENAAWRAHVVQPPPAGHHRDEKAVAKEERGSPVWASKVRHALSPSSSLADEHGSTTRP